jgi:2'-5' RNA ligase
MSEKTFILTAEIDGESFAWLDALRQRHFPPERNFLPAHLTLFHRCSRRQIHQLRLMEMPPEPIGLDFDAVRSLGAGVAIHASSAMLERFRHDVKEKMGGPVSRQDDQRWIPHVTIQNKVPADVARALHRKMESQFSARTGSVPGLLIWEYLNGPWKLMHRLPFESVRTR